MSRYRVPRTVACEGKSVYFTIHRRVGGERDIDQLVRRIRDELSAIRAEHSRTEPCESGGWLDTYRVSIPVGVGQRWTAWLEASVSSFALPHGRTLDRSDPFAGSLFLASGTGRECRATGAGEDTRAAKSRAALKARQVTAGVFTRPPLPEQLMFSLFGKDWRWSMVPDCPRYDDGLSTIHDGWEGTKQEWRKLEERWLGFAPVFHLVRDTLTLAQVGVEGHEGVEFGRWRILHVWIQAELNKAPREPAHQAAISPDRGKVPQQRDLSTNVEREMTLDGWIHPSGGSLADYE